MIEAWIAVLFAAVIVLGVVGGTVLQTVLKELLPLLRTLVEERKAGIGAGGEIHERLVALERQVAAMEARHGELKTETEFLQNLLAEPEGRRPLERDPK